MRPMSLAGNPLVSFRQVRPPSVDLKIPLPGPPPARRHQVDITQLYGKFGRPRELAAPVLNLKH